MKKRYALFAGLQYYPCGGWGDLKQTFFTLTEANKAYEEDKRSQNNWRHIVDLETLDILRNSDNE